MAEQQKPAVPKVEPEVAVVAKYVPRKPLGTKVVVRPVFGPMLDPFVNKHIPEGEETRVDYSAWIESQIDAGKLTLVKD